jgi:hypothetical protein
MTQEYFCGAAADFWVGPAETLLSQGKSSKNRYVATQHDGC